MSVEIPEGVRHMIGKEKVRTHLVTASEIRRFAQAIGDSNPIYQDDSQEADLLAPPLFCQALTYEAVPVEQLPADGSPLELHVPIDAARTVGGGSEYVVDRAVRAGERVTIRSRLKDVYAKQGKSGTLFMVVVETRFTDAEGGPIASELATYIKRV